MTNDLARPWGHGPKSALALLIVLLSACAPTMASEDITAALRGTTFTRIGDYKIGSADLLTIKVFGEESLSGQFEVTPSGILQLPLVGNITAQGLSTVQLAQRIEQLLTPYLKTPRVVVGLANSLSFQVYFSGEVKSQGAKELRLKTSLLQGLILAGGLTDLATGRIFLIRHIGDQEVRRYATTYKDLLRGGKTLDFLFLERGDIIHAD